MVSFVLRLSFSIISMLSIFIILYAKNQLFSIRYWVIRYSTNLSACLCEMLETRTASYMLKDLPEKKASVSRVSRNIAGRRKKELVLRQH